MTECPSATSDRSALVQVFYGLSRAGSPAATATLLSEFRELVGRLFFEPKSTEVIVSDWDRGAILAMVLQTRDLAGGKGEYGLFYLLMGELFMCDYERAAPRSPTAPLASRGGLSDVLVQMMASLVLPREGGGPTGAPIRQLEGLSRRPVPLARDGGRGGARANRLLQGLPPADGWTVEDGSGRD